MDHDTERSYKELLNRVVTGKYAASTEEKTYNDIVNRMLRYFDDKKKEKWYNQEIIDKLPEYMRSKIIIPAGSILRGFNAPGYTGSFSNCYYIPIEEDSIEGIFETTKRLARIFSKRGGVGIDITILRPKDTPVNNAAKYSTGAVSFMPLFSEVTDTIGQQGRRGALLMSMDVRHPDIEDFIMAKTSKADQVFKRDAFTGRVKDISHANISVKLTDEFMKAVEEDSDWNLVFPDIQAVGTDVYTREWDGNYKKWEIKGYPLKIYKTVKAKELYNKIAESVWECGDPGVLFVDTAQRWTPVSDIYELIPMGTNP